MPRPFGRSCFKGRVTTFGAFVSAVLALLAWPDPDSGLPSAFSTYWFSLLISTSLSCPDNPESVETLFSLFSMLFALCSWFWTGSLNFWPLSHPDPDAADYPDPPEPEQVALMLLMLPPDPRPDPDTV
jgi:hypothetical protein